MRRMALFLIKLYQNTVSLDHGLPNRIFKTGTCRFYPSCSQYTYESVEKFGFVRGLFLGSKRVLRCHPWNEGGHDPVPKK